MLILDEPANGLDPEGIFWMRELLRDFADRGGTVLLSSHLLREVEVVADQLMVIGDGRIVAQGSKAELLRHGGTLRPRASTRRRSTTACAAAGLAATPAARRRARRRGRARGGRAGRGRARRARCIELRPADGGGLEQLFLTLTPSEAKPLARRQPRPGWRHDRRCAIQPTRPSLQRLTARRAAQDASTPAPASGCCCSSCSARSRWWR